MMSDYPLFPGHGQTTDGTGASTEGWRCSDVMALRSSPQKLATKKPGRSRADATPGGEPEDGV